MSPDQVVVVRRGGTTWGIPGGQVLGIAREREVLRVLFEGGSAPADEILAIQHVLKVSPAPASIRRRWPVPCRGVAVWQGVPLAVVDGRQMPGFREEG